MMYMKQIVFLLKIYNTDIMYDIDYSLENQSNDCIYFINK